MPDNRISFSQFHMWKTCPRRWKLKYVDNIRIEQPGIAALFGTAMHETLQEYLTVLYTKSVAAANEIDLHLLLKERIENNYKQLLVENNNVHFSTSTELSEYYDDGIKIINYFKKNRDSIFPKKHYELVGIEIPIDTIASTANENIRFVGYLDVVVKDTKTNKYYIYDFKTSTRGWSKYQKTDKVKISQLVLYKKLFAEKYNCLPSDIDVEYLILKRKIVEDAQYGNMLRRIQRFRPANGTTSLKTVTNEIDKFVQTAFKENGEYNTDITYLAIAGNNSYNCTFCEFKNDEKLCPKNERITE
jgi:hypothetical protein